MIKQLRSWSLAMIGFALLLPAMASAHVIVTPSQAGVGQELVFNVSSPNERQTPIVKVTLDIPQGVGEVVPTAKDGWTITTTTAGSDSGVEINSITWSGDQVPVGQRSDFSFSAQVPGTPATLNWKAYQTYADGTIVHWDQTPRGSDDATGNAGPFSVTKVVNDLSPTPVPHNNDNLPLAIACLALVISVAALLRPGRQPRI